MQLLVPMQAAGEVEVQEPEGGTSPGPGAGGVGGPGVAMPGMEYPYVGLPGIQPLMPGANSPSNNHYGAGGGGWGYSLQNSGNRPIGSGGAWWILHLPRSSSN